MELLQKSLTSLSQRDLSASRSFALQALKSDPNLAGDVDRVLAVAGVLLAGDRRLSNDRLDFYAILQLGRADWADSQRVWTQFEKLVTPHGAGGVDVPFVAEAHDLLFEAWSVLSDREKKRRYEAEIEEEGGTFWTACPYCFYLFEYGKVYDECCLRCQNCKRAFHGVAIGVPSPEIVAPGKDRYYFCYGVIPLCYKEGNFDMNDANERKEALVEIAEGDSSDSSIDLGSSGDDEDGDFDGFWEEVTKNGKGSGSQEVRVGDEKRGKEKFVKARARRTKKVKSMVSKKARRSRGSEPAETGKKAMRMDVGMVVGVVVERWYFMREKMMCLLI